MKVGVLGGSFDPPHNGHLAIADAAMSQLEFDEVVFVPALRNPLKAARPIASARDRLEMTRLAIETEPKFCVSDQEIQRKGPSFTIDTIHELMAIRNADYWLIIGFDSLAGFHEWRSYLRILKCARLACVYRGKASYESELYRVSEDVQPYVDVIEVPKIDISSTDIRCRIQEGKPWSNLVPSAVETYIRKNQLYR